jgi:hypothetical protein
MTDNPDHPCPPWCEQPAGHLDLTPGADYNGDFHSGEIATIDLPEIPGLRDDSWYTVSVEQYVTDLVTYPAAVSLDESRVETFAAMTPAEAGALAAALHQAIATIGATPPGPEDYRPPGED